MFRTNMYVNFMVRLMGRWNREVVESPLEMFKTHLDAYWYGICFSRGLGHCDFLRFLPTPLILRGLYVCICLLFEQSCALNKQNG